MDAHALRAAQPIASRTVPEHLPSSFKLTTRIALATSALALLFLFVVGAFTYSTTRAQITRSELRALDNHAELIAQRFAANISAVVHTLGPLAQNTLILNSLMDSLTRDTSLAPFLNDFSTVNGFPVAVTLVDFEGNAVAGRGDISVSIDQWHKTVLTKGEAYAAIWRESGDLKLLIALPVFFARTMSPEGALIHQVTLPQSAFSSITHHQKLRLLLGGKPILAAQRAQGDATHRATQIDEIGPQALSRIRKLDLPPMLSDLDLAIEITANRDTLRRPLSELLQIYITSGLAILVITIAMSIFLARRLTLPLRDLERSATTVVTSGSFEHRFDVTGAPEVRRLAEAFNRMLDRLGIAYGKLESEAQNEARRREELSQSNLRLQAEVMDRRRAESDAERATRMLAQAIENMTDGFALFDEERRLVICNETYRKMFPLMAPYFVDGARLDDLVEKADELGQIQQVVHSESGRDVERTATWRTEVPLEMLTHEGRWILARNRHTDHGQLVYVRIDITKRKHTEQTLAEHAMNLARSNAELEQFAYVASHDLKEPLRKVHSFSDLLQMDCAEQLDATGKEYLQRIRTSCDRMQRLIDDLLTFSRMSATSEAHGPVDLNEVVEQVTSDLSMAISESGGRVEAEQLPSVIGDPVHMGQLFQNLIGNALKYARKDISPVVHISWSDEDLPPGATLTHRAESPRCELSVKDNGIGFEQKYAERIFGVFQRLHGVGDYPGTGIGLALCRKIVERHGGSIEAHSQPGAGTEIRFSLQLASQIAPFVEPEAVL